MNFFIGANLKMNKTYSDLKKYNLELEKKFKKLENLELMIAPNFTWLNIFSENKNISLWSQNMSCEDFWAYTWEISVWMLKDLNCKYVILGHSEVRKNLWEDFAILNKKAKLALKNNIIPIICISKKNQLLELKSEILESEIIIAYEPVSAIWTGKIDDLEDISENIYFIKSKLPHPNPLLKGEENIRIIYWGSVNSSNCLELSKIKNLNWFLIWWASLEVDSLLEIVDFLKN